MASYINGEEAIKNAEIDKVLWEEIEIIKNCTVQILKDKDGNYSIGWWRE